MRLPLPLQSHTASPPPQEKKEQSFLTYRLSNTSPPSGRTHTVPATDLDIADVRTTFETNVLGVMATTKHFIAPLIAARGLILNISSGASIVPYPFAAAYSASKGAVNAYSRTLRQELRPYGVRVMVAITGTVRTNINLQTDRALPAESLYRPIEDVYKWRLTFSRNTPSAVTPAVYAERLVRDALKPEWPIWLRGIFGFGRPDWHYFGGLAKLLWFGSCFGEWLSDIIIYRMFKLHLLENLLKKQQQAEAKRLKDA